MSRRETIPQARPGRAGSGIATVSTTGGRSLVARGRNAREYADAAWSRLHSGERGPILVTLGLVALWLVFYGLNENFLSPVTCPTSAWTSWGPAWSPWASSSCC
ncbi:hypothetical protein [Streptomyces rhizosphaericus]|uniref:hypothetical protein n=1 Tax=Streptomyces rhizosphaericus TaxID=114699 RepID=UPI00363A0526